LVSSSFYFKNSFNFICTIICWDYNNNVLFKVPPRDFKEEWIGFRESYNEGVNEIKNYNFQECRIPYKKGNLILADFATIHASSRKDGCGPRVSIDTTFAVKRSKEEQDMAEKKMHKWRKNERISPEELYDVGASKFFYFPDSLKLSLQENDFCHFFLVGIYFDGKYFLFTTNYCAE